MPIALGRIEAVLIGKAVPYTRPGTYSGIDKAVLAGPVQVRRLGLCGDEQGDPRVHGGVDKAIHQYPAEHYSSWTAELGHLPLLEKPGAFGENIHSRGMTEADICLGDRLRVGSLVVAVSQGRLPCWKLNDRFGVADMALRIQQTQRCGWYYRVIEEGCIAAGDLLQLIDRPHPAWSIQRIAAAFHAREMDVPLLQELLELPLVPSWRKIFQRRLDTLCVEDWSARLQGPPRDGGN
ncbi:MOSC domain-containing protein [Azotobacter salinestris]|uniref:MOSC domain-containing protein n=1 Tax=Azotobacter salinestris TaxID=69964 RepID=UPI0032E02054